MQATRHCLKAVTRHLGEKVKYNGHIGFYLPNTTIYSGQEVTLPYKLGISITCLFWCFIGFHAG